MPSLSPIPTFLDACDALLGTMTPTPIAARRIRGESSAIKTAQAIGQLLWSLECIQADALLTRLQDQDRKTQETYRSIGELAVKLLDPEAVDLATMAAADVISSQDGEYGPLAEEPAAIQRTYFAIAKASVNAALDTLRFDSKDPHLDRTYLTILDRLDTAAGK